MIWFDYICTLIYIYIYTSAGICNAFLPNCSFVVHRWIAQKSMLFSNHDDDAGAGMQCIAQVVFMIDADADVDLPVCLLLMWAV